MSANFFSKNIKILILMFISVIVVNCSNDDVVTKPVLLVTGAFSDYETVEIDQDSDTQIIVVKGENLSAGISISVTGDFIISFDDLNYSNSLQISKEDAINSTKVYTRMRPSKEGDITSVLTIKSEGATDKVFNLEGNGILLAYRYTTFNKAHLGFGGGLNQALEKTFTLQDDMSNIDKITMFVKLDCPTGGCNAWDVFAHIQVRDVDSNEWYEIGRYITPYGVDNHQLDRGFEIDVTDFKSLLRGNVELRAYIEVWGSDGWELSVDFDYQIGTPDYEYYAISKVIQFNRNSLEGVPYGVDASTFDLTKSITIPENSKSTHLRTIITGWGHATPSDANGRPCAEWCFRTHDVLIDQVNTFQHKMEPIGCSSNIVSPQGGNWTPDRAGWCPGMAVPVRIDKFTTTMSGVTFNFEYDFEDWTADGGSTSGTSGAYYAISTFIVVKSETVINKPIIVE